MPRRSSPASPKFTYTAYLNETEKAYYTTMAHTSSSNSSVRSAASTTPSSAPSIKATKIENPKYVDERWPLIHHIDYSHVPASIPRDHMALKSARLMASIHNTIIRAINAAYNQAPFVKAAHPDTADFLFFNKMIVDTIHHHHSVEDNFLFDQVEKLLNKPGCMEENVAQHEAFTPGLNAYEKWTEETTPETYDSAVLLQVLDSFLPDFIQHMHDEIPTLVNTYTADHKALKAIWDNCDKEATKDMDLYTAAPFIIFNQVKGFEIDGVPTTFPDAPWLLVALVRNWHARRHAGAWKFCASTPMQERRLMPTTA